MSKSNFTLDAKFYDDLLGRLEEEQAKSNELERIVEFAEDQADDDSFAEDDSSTIPTRVHLQELVEITFWASLQKEEGRPLTFSVGYVPPSGETSEIIFQNARPFNVHNLMKLAPCVGMSRTEIGVFANEQGNCKYGD